MSSEAIVPTSTQPSILRPWRRDVRLQPSVVLTTPLLYHQPQAQGHGRLVSLWGVPVERRKEGS